MHLEQNINHKPSISKILPSRIHSPYKCSRIMARHKRRTMTAMVVQLESGQGKFEEEYELDLMGWIDDILLGLSPRRIL